MSRREITIQRRHGFEVLPVNAWGRVAVPVGWFPENEKYNHWILTIVRGFYRRIAETDDVATVLVFLEGVRDVDDEGTTADVVPFDLRLNVSDMQTLRRLIGPSPPQWIGAVCVVEARYEGRPGDRYGEGRRFVRVARPDKWAAVLSPLLGSEWRLQLHVGAVESREA